MAVKKAILSLSVLLFLVAACSPAAKTIEVTRQIEVTRPVQQTEIVRVPVESTVLVIVTATPLPVTPTPSGPTATPAPTLDQTKSPKGIGSYMAGSEIALGVWRSTGIINDYLDGECYAKVSDLSGNLKDNTLEPMGSTFRVPAGDYIVVLDNCEWTFLKP